MTLKVGLTGGIGSGKSFVCRLFEQQGIPVYYADARAKSLMITNKNLKAAIKTLLGTTSFHPNGKPNRKYIGEKIFGDKSLLSAMNQLVHPAVQQDTVRWFAAQHSPYAIKEAAILFESKANEQVDYVICVTAPQEIRIQRVMRRDKLTKDQVLAKMEKQWPEEEKIKRSNFVIHNDGQTDLLAEVLHIHRQLLALQK